MSIAEAVDQHAPRRRGGQSSAFRKRRNARLPTQDQLRRQSDVLEFAWRHFRDAAPMIAFLNTRHDLLDGQPLHLAIESDEGLERVERLLQQLTA